MRCPHILHLFEENISHSIYHHGLCHTHPHFRWGLSHTDGRPLDLLFSLDLDLPHSVHDLLKLIVLSNHWVTAPPDVHLTLVPGLFVLQGWIRILCWVLDTYSVDIDFALKLLDDLTLQA